MLEGCLQRFTVIDVLQDHAANQPETVAFIYLSRDGNIEKELTYEELLEKAKLIAGHLRDHIREGDAIVLCYPPGLDYVLTFYACLYAGVIAVPLYPPMGRANTERFIKAAKSCHARIILTSSLLEKQLHSRLAVIDNEDPYRILCTDKLTHSVDCINRSKTNGEAIAFLQYTSGSTGSPKGVMVSHGNIIANLEALKEVTGCDAKDIFVNWLPLYHDLGLVNTMLLPIYLGTTSVLMSPLTFVNSPIMWFKAITKYRGTICGGPNFSYQLCLKKITEQDLAGLDLSSWRIAFNAAEPINVDTLNYFSKLYANIGFDAQATYPSYGMAEATVFLTGGNYEPRKTKLVNDKGVISCGKHASKHEIIIVNPESCVRIEDGEVGEIWARGPSIAKGYWNLDDKTKETFHARVVDGDEYNQWMRTGDYGFIQDRELYVTGRLKETLIIRGQNIYPTDLERTAQEASQDLRYGCGAAFSVEVENVERLVIVQEVNRQAIKKLNVNRIYSSIIAKIAQEYQIDVYAIVLIAPGQIYKTTSGKIQRLQCKKLYESGNISFLDQYKEGDSNLISEFVEPESDLEKKIASAICHVFEIKKISKEQNFFALGANSILLTQALSEVSTKLDIAVAAEVIFLHPTVEALAHFIEMLDSTKNNGGDNDILSSHISKADRTENIPLSYAQEGLWFIWKLEGASPIYNEFQAFKITGALDVSALSSSILTLFERHEVLKTRVVETDGKAGQVFDHSHPYIRLDEEFVDIESMNNLLKQEREFCFNLEKDVLCRFRLVKCEDSYTLAITMHHIIMDGWSMAIFSKELSALYNAKVKGHTCELGILDIQYADYTCWQKEKIQGSVIEAQLDYWKRHLDEIPTLHSLPLDKKRPVEQTFHGKRHLSKVDKKLRGKILQFVQSNETTLYIFLQAAFSLLLSRYSRESNVVFGSPTSGRINQNLNQLMGYFINTLVVRSDISEEESFSDLLSRSKESSVAAYKNQYVPFDMLVNELQVTRDISFNPLVQIALVVQNFGDVELKFSGTEVDVLPPDTESVFVKYDLELAVTEEENTIDLAWTYNSDLFHGETIEQLSEYLNLIIEPCISNPNAPLKTLVFLSDNDRKKQLGRWDQPKSSEKDSQLIYELFEQSAKAFPDKIAAIYEEQQLTYAQLNDQANRLANYLVNQGVQSEEFVALFLTNSPDMIVAILAVLKAGGAYVPIDPNTPKARAEHILVDCQARIILTRGYLADKLPNSSSRTICLDDVSVLDKLASLSGQNLECSRFNNVTQVAYIIYTSGSTGQPKGVMVTHHNVMRLFSSSEEVYSFSSDDVWTNFHSYAFDFSVWEIWGALFYGGTLVLVPYWVSRDVEKFIDLIQQHKVSVLNQTPGAFERLLQSDRLSGRQNLSSLRYIIFGGEALDYNAVADWFERYDEEQAQLVNMYGITETTVHVTHYRIQKGDANFLQGSIIGRPLSDLRLFILDENLNLLPSGARGEIHVAGPGLARGYLNLPDMTKDRFIRKKFNSDLELDLYRTGDLARYLSDGNLVYLGRKDDQVKIRGFRIELGDIESALENYVTVKTAVVLAQELNAQHKQLVAYIVLEEGLANGDTTNEIRAYLGDILPSYMIPSAMVYLSTLPLTMNGKIDKKALSKKKIVLEGRNEASFAYDDTEKTLCAIWQRLLKVESVGLHDNFFTLGGDSIIAIQVVSQARLDGIHFSVRDLFKHQTISALKPYADTKSSSTLVSQESVSGTQVLLPIQRLFFERNLANPHHHNQSVSLLAPEGFNEQGLRSILTALFLRHDAFRLRFNLSGKEITANYLEFFPSMIEESIVVEHMSGLEASQHALHMQDTILRIHASLNIESGPLFKAVCFGAGKNVNRIVLIAHHLIIDGVSWRTLLSDIETCWRNIVKGSEVSLADKTASYKAWAEYLEDYSYSEALKSEKKFWLSQLSQHDSLPLGLQNEGVSYDTYHENTISFRCDDKQTELLLGECNKPYNTNIRDLLLAAFVTASQALTGEEKINLFIESHGREHSSLSVDTSETMGWFTSLFPLAIGPIKSDHIGDAIKLVKESLRSVPNNGIGYGLLKYICRDGDINKLSGGNDLGVVFNYLGQIDNSAQLDTAFTFENSVSGLSNDRRNAPLASLEINALVYQGELVVNLTYCQNIIDDEIVNNLADKLNLFLQQCIDHCMVAKKSYTPSDFHLVDINQSALDKHLPILEKNAQSNIVDIYPLATTQEEILFHCLSSNVSGAYQEQIHFTFKESVCEESWKLAWEKVFENCEVFHTAFDHEKFSSPVQVVYESTSLPWETKVIDASGYDELDLYISKDIQHVFEKEISFDRSPLSKLLMYKGSHGEQKFVWLFHHILLDGWSMSLIIKDVLNIYKHLIDGTEYSLDPYGSYGEFIKWRKDVDIEKSKLFWKEYLKDVKPLKMELDKVQVQSTPNDSGMDLYEKVLPQSRVEELDRFAKQISVTKGCLFHAVFSIALSQFCNQTDLLYGETQSGRPAELAGIENIPGMFIHTKPVRVVLDKQMSVKTFLRELNTSNIDREQCLYVSLADIVRVAKLQQTPPFSYLLVVQNYPMDNQTIENSGILRKEDIEHRATNSFPFTLTVVLGSLDVPIYIRWDKTRFSRNDIEKFLDILQFALDKILEDGEAKIGDLMSMLNLSLAEYEREMMKRLKSKRSRKSRDRVYL